jgi:hypothetical protein
MVERVAKITAQLGFRGVVTERLIIGLIMCFIDSITEEIGSLGKYLRMGGQFAGRFLVDPITGEIMDYAASECILPKLGGGWVASLCDRQDGPRPTADGSKETGVTWKPPVPAMQAKLQIGLKPVAAGKPSQTGYEYTIEVLELDSRVADPMTAALAQLDGGTLAAKPAAITREAAD